MKRQKTLFLATIAALTLSGVGLGAGLILSKNTSQKQQVQPAQVLAASTYEGLPFPVYFPDPMPNGVSLRQGSVSRTESVYAYVLDTATNSFVYISIQPVAYEVVSSIKADQEFQTYSGRAYVVSRDTGKTSAAVITDKVMILLNAPSGIADHQLRQVIDSLRQVN